MRTIILPIIILSAFSMAAFSQTKISTIKQNRDVNGAPISNIPVQLGVPYSLTGIMTAYSYDSVRALTEINNPNFADAYPWISSDGLRLYYTSDSAIGNRLAFTQRPDTNSFFITPTILPISVPNVMSCWLTQDELGMYFSDGFNIYYTQRDSISSPFNTPIHIHLSGINSGFISGESLNTAQNQLFVYSDSPPSILEFSRSSDTSFNFTGTLSAPSGYSLEVGQLSKDDLTIFFGASVNGGTILLYQMNRATVTDSFDTSTFQQIQGINDSSIVFAGMPSMSNSLDWVAFVRALSLGWDSNNLFLAHKGIITSVFNPDDKQISSSAFPNPASEQLFIRYKTSSSTPISLSVISSVGTLVYEDVITPSADKITIDTRSMKDGLYIYRLSQEANNHTISGTGRFAVLH